MRAKFRGSAAAAVAVVLSACTVGPDYVRPVQPIPEEYVSGDSKQQELPRPKTRWWTQFGSDELNWLVDTALANNHDVRAAMQRIAQAQAKAGMEAGSLLPVIQGTGKAQTGKKSQNDFGASSTLIQQLNAVGLEASYELDLWGKNRSNMAAALATAHASVYERETVVVTLISDVVTTYLQYLQAAERVAVAKRNIENMLRVQAKVIKRQRIGEGTELEVFQQETALRNAEANLPVIELGQDQQLNRLAFLLGTVPGELRLQGRSMDSLVIPEFTPGLPSELLLRRPDIRRAEANLVAANANINMARAKLFPSLTLTADRGWSSSDVFNLLSPGSIAWTLGAKLVQPLFDNGKTNSEITYYEARWNELIEIYRQSIVASLRDVEDALATIRRFDARNKAQIAMVRAARDSYRMSQDSFSIGITDYLTVLETERTQYSAEDGLIQSRYARYAAAVALFKALGGGTEDEPEQIPAAAKDAGGYDHAAD
jgi:multidrug efflux system outer membrane protein